VATDLTITGKVAQFGRGVLADVSAKLLDQFVANLESTVLVQEDEHGPKNEESHRARSPVTRTLIRRVPRNQKWLLTACARRLRNNGEQVASAGVPMVRKLLQRIPSDQLARRCPLISSISPGVHWRVVS